jgi:hypothetical protein
MSDETTIDMMTTSITNRRVPVAGIWTYLAVATTMLVGTAVAKLIVSPTSISNPETELDRNDLFVFPLASCQVAVPVADSVISTCTGVGEQV